MPRPDFKTALLLAPLGYAIHHAEEHLFMNFRAWRLNYFADNNALSTEAVFVLLTGITLSFLVLHSLVQNRATAWSILLFLMASQVANIGFHVGGSLAFQDFSPGTITAILVYLPVNILIMRAALYEGWASPLSLTGLLFAGVATFVAFEMVGPFPMLAVILACYGWIGVSAFRKPSAAD